MILKRLLIAAILSCLFMGSISAQNKYTISGTVKDFANGEGLIGATVTVKEIRAGASVNEYGFYSITLPEGNYTIVYGYIGYLKMEQKIELKANVQINIELKEEILNTEEVVVSAKKDNDNITNVEMSTNKLDISTIKKIPALLGEVDVIKSIILLPGVSTVGEGASGFNVRGGAIDQNLVLLDEAPVYNSSHLFGFFSIFNPDAVKEVKLYKGGMPAQYGGRLSSVLDVRMKEGNSKKFTATGGVGLIFSRLALEAPINKGKGSFIIAGRRSYGDLFLAFAPDEDLKKSSLYFYDLSTKLNYKLNDKNQVFLSSYIGRDKFGVPEFGFNWGNATTTFRWNHVFGQKLFSNFTAFYSNYDYELGTLGNSVDVFNWKSRLINYSTKYEFSYFLNPNNTLTFGAQAIYYEFRPATINVKSKGVARPEIIKPYKYALESAAYIGNDQKLGARFSMTYGLRFSYFTLLGPGSTNNFGPSSDPRDPKKVLSTDQYGDGAVIAAYPNLEPRFSAKYELNDQSSIKLSYNRNAQYIHLLSNTAASIPLDIWTPSSNNIKPQIANQVALGYFRNLKDNNYEVSAEGFYKLMENQLDFVPYANLLINDTIEKSVLAGKGRAYGAEFYIRKTKGKLTGWLSYTLSRTERKVDGVSMNQWYASRFDKLHNVTLVGIYQLKKRMDLSCNFAFGSGTPMTIGSQKFYIDGVMIGYDYSEKRSNYRIPPYFRIDMALTIKNKKKNEDQRWEGEWVFSVYNLTNRSNPFTVYVIQDPYNSSQAQGFRFSIFASVIPGITYNFKF